MDEQTAAATPKLGFGLMRLPRKLGRIDLKRVEQMVDLFLENGFTYFDTAHVYLLGSEEAAGKALVKRHPRESFTLASKLFAATAPTVASAHKQFETTLKRTDAGYIDYYLLHALSRSTYQKYEKFGLWDWAQKQKDAELIRQVGFSFHADPELLDQLLTEHPEVDFVQVPIPEVFDALNMHLDGQTAQAQAAYDKVIAINNRGPANCIECGGCEGTR
jgi:predicted aldo/keto reductase-like oxidoreductase